MINIEQKHIDKLIDICGNDCITIDNDIIAPHLKEWRDKYHGNTPIILFPDSVGKIQNILKYANENNIKIVTQGGNTGLVAAQIPFGEILLSTKKLNKIIEVLPNDDAIIIEAGVSLKTVQEIAKDNNKKFALSIASEGTATIGGIISTNAGGVHVRKYGMMRSLVMGIEAVLPNGEIFSQLSPLRKDNTGYDLKQFFIGAEGTLGIITKATLKLVPNLKNNIVAMVGFNDLEKIIYSLHQIEEKTDALIAFEIMNKNAINFCLKNIKNTKPIFNKDYEYTALIEFASNMQNINEIAQNILFELLENQICEDVIIAQNDKQAQDFWHIRESMSAAQKPEGKAAKHDISVPISQIPNLFKNAQIALDNYLKNIRISAFGHISDGNIHYDAIKPIEMTNDEYDKLIPQINEIIHDICEELGGSISAEHGIGIARLDEFLKREPKTNLELIKSIKKSFDPNNILNPRIAFD